MDDSAALYGSLVAATAPVSGRAVEIPAPGADDEASLRALAAAFTPRYEQAQPGVVVLDLRGLTRLFGTADAVAEAIRHDARGRGLRVHLALAASRVASLLLALARPGTTVVPPDQTAAALAPLPVWVLERLPARDVPSAPDRMRATLARWGVRTLGALAALPAADLTARLGRQGAVWQALAAGRDQQPLLPHVPEERFEATYDFEWPVEGWEPLSFVLTRLLEPLLARLAQRDRAVAGLHLVLRLATQASHTCHLEMPSPLREARALRTLVQLSLEAHPPDGATERVTLTLDPTPGRVLQHTLFARPHPTPEQLSTLVARLGALMGPAQVGAPATLDSHRPGACALVPFRLDQPEGAEAGAAGRLPAQVAALRRVRPPVAVRVRVGPTRQPVEVVADRAVPVQGRVRACAGPWRTSGGWWEGAAACGQGHWSRDEWDVALDQGVICRLFRDRSTDTWFLDAVVD